jgi:tripartite ATP-independent transporter DctP family solute receptor
MKKITAIKVLMVTLFLSLMVVPVFAAGKSEVSNKPEVLKFAHVYEPSTVYNEAALEVKRLIEERSNGRFEIQIFPSSQLGNEEAITEGLKMDSIQLAYSGPTFLGQFYAPIAISEAPYVWKDYDHWKKYQYSDIFTQVSDGYYNVTGNVVPSIIYFGERTVTANRPILTPDDMKGMKIRVANATLWKIFPEAVGAKPTPVSFAEVYLALQQGVVEGQDNPITIVESNKFYEVQKYINRTQHILCSIVGIIGGPLYDRLSDEDQKMFVEVFKEVGTRYSDKVRETELGLYEEYKQSKKAIVETTEVEKFAEIVLPQTRKIFGDDLVDAIQALK